MNDFTDKLTELVNYLDDRVEDLGGYSLTVNHYDFGIGIYHLNVVVFPDSLAEAQRVSNALNLNLTQDKTYPWAYRGIRDGVEYSFHVDEKDPDNNPARFAPRAVTV